MGAGPQPPVTLMWRPTAGRLVRRSMMKSWPLGLRAIASSMASISSASSALARNGARVGGVILAEAHVERAGAGEADAVAALAEIMRERRDEAELPSCLAHREVPRGAAGAVVGLVEVPVFLQAAPHHREREVLVEALLAADVAHRHHLDEDEVEAFLA